MDSDDASHRAAVNSGPVMTRSPYQGLVPFTEGDSKYFFGRESEKRLISASLLASRFTLLYGPTGVGKTSLLRAGVAVSLNAIAKSEREARGRSPYLAVPFSSWGGDPIRALAGAVQAAVQAMMSDASLQLGWSHDLSRLIRDAADVIGGPILLLLDQFEEYFIHERIDNRNGRFADELSSAVTDLSLPASFLVSIREDAVARLDQFGDRIPNVFDNYLRLSHLSRESAREAITKPVEEFNRRQSTDHQPSHPTRVEPEFVEAILSELEGKQGTARSIHGLPGQDYLREARRIEAPYLQLVLVQLWKAEVEKGSNVLSLSTFKELGGAKPSIRSHVEGILSQLPPEEQLVALGCFRFLVTPSGGKVSLDSPTLANWITTAPESRSLPGRWTERSYVRRIRSVLDKLASPDARILRRIESPTADVEPAYEVFLDVLAEALQTWRPEQALLPRAAFSFYPTARSYPELLVALFRQRALAVVVTNMILAVTLLFPLVRSFRSRLDETIIFCGFMVAIAASCALIFTGWRGFPKEIGRLLAGEDVMDVARPSQEGRNWRLMFLALVVAVLIEFYAIGRLVGATGGLPRSPFALVVFEMLVLGQLMATTRRTMFALFALGTLYYVLLAYSNLFGGQGLQLVEGQDLRVWFVWVAGTSLFISAAVNNLVRLKR